MSFDPLYEQFVYYFNYKRDYYECHEVMETLWLEEGRDPLWQGMLQIAVGLHHHENGNPSGAIKLLQAGLEKLAPHRETSTGIDMPDLLAKSERRLGELRLDSQTAFRPFDLVVTDPELEKAVHNLVMHPPSSHD